MGPTGPRFAPVYIYFLDIARSRHQKYVFSQNQVLAFLTYIVIEGVDMLTKRSTSVDQNLGSESIPSKLSVAIFVASRTLLGTQECLIYQKKSKKGTTRADPLYWLVDCAIYIYI